MTDAFRAGLDVHLLTGVGLAARQGFLDLGGLDAGAYLAAADAAAMKDRLTTQRQSAKALNFGLLYGMQAEALTPSGWSITASPGRNRRPPTAALHSLPFSQTSNFYSCGTSLCLYLRKDHRHRCIESLRLRRGAGTKWFA